MRFLLLALPLLLAPACGSSVFSTNIADLHAKSRDYDGQQVTVRGKVVQCQDLLLSRQFVLEDATGRVCVVTERALPNVGDELTVSGQCFQLGSGAIGDTISAALADWGTEEQARTARSAIRELKAN